MLITNILSGFCYRRNIDGFQYINEFENKEVYTFEVKVEMIELPNMRAWRDLVFWTQRPSLADELSAMSLVDAGFTYSSPTKTASSSSSTFSSPSAVAKSSAAVLFSPGDCPLFFVNILITNLKILIAECEPDTEDPEMKAALKASLLLTEKRSAEDTGALEKRQRSK